MTLATATTPCHPELVSGSVRCEGAMKARCEILKQVQHDLKSVSKFQNDTGDRQKDERLITTIRKRMGIYTKKEGCHRDNQSFQLTLKSNTMKNTMQR